MWYQKQVKEFMVHNGFMVCNTDNIHTAILSAQRQSEQVSNTVYVDDVDGNCIARCYKGYVEYTR